MTFKSDPLNVVGGKMKLCRVFACASVVIFSGQSFAAKMNSHCYAPLSAVDKIKGDNINERIPIASVSKLVTSYWAVKSKGVDYRFQTLVYLTPVAEDTFDLHIQGSRDPYFGAEQLHYMISELNKRGIKKIRNFTYDQNFKYLWFSDDTKSNQGVAVGYYLRTDPSPLEVQKQLRAFSKLTQGYDETRDKAKSRGLNMVEKPEFSVQSFDPINQTDFRPAHYSKVFLINSVKLTSILKEMNRNSNNHAANQIFEHLGSSRPFAHFLDTTLGLKTNDILMLNGSGDRLDTASGARYNEASCAAMLKIFVDLQNTLSAQGSSIAKVATVIGTNSGSATKLYHNSATAGAVAAKTGTVNPAVTLGGILSTKKGPYVFMINVDPQTTVMVKVSKKQKVPKTKFDFTGGRGIIRQKLTQMMYDLGGPANLNAQPFSFISFDDKTFSELELPKELK